jgi:hypothetical protein
MSNDPKRIREFLRANPLCIYKPFYPAAWHASDRVAVVFSSLVTEDDLPEPPVLQSTPGIFQRLVEKSYELRITALGNRMFTAKLDSQCLSTARIDWRAATQPVPVEPVELPEPVANACRRIMRDLGIVFGCFDLIVTPEGEYVFLEVNESGAFLWIVAHWPGAGSRGGEPAVETRCDGAVQASAVVCLGPLRFRPPIAHPAPRSGRRGGVTPSAT